MYVRVIYTRMHTSAIHLHTVGTLLLFLISTAIQVHMRQLGHDATFVCCPSSIQLLTREMIVRLRATLSPTRVPHCSILSARPWIVIVGITSVSVAAHKGREEIVKMLIAANADVNIDSNNGSTPLIQASHFGEFIPLSEVDLCIHLFSAL